MRRAFAIVAAAAALLGTRGAAAYCRSATCADGGPDGTTAGKVCDPAQPDDCGIELQWRQPCMSFDVQQGASAQVGFATADATLGQAFATWAGSPCDGGTPSFQIFDFGPVSCDRTEYNQQAGNANILIFRDDSWPHDIGGGGVDTLALTTVTYDVDTGDIYDADIEVNTADNTFTTSDDPGPTDVNLLSVLTHETGHFLGLAHTQAVGATMFASYTPGTLAIRQTQPDDVAAMCDAYPVDRQATGACTGLPRHGWSPLCANQQTNLGCATDPRAPGHRTGGGAAALALALALPAALRRSRLRGRRGSRGS